MADTFSFTDPRYPKALLTLSDPPPTIYIQGAILPEDSRAIAIVGTRLCTQYGLEMAAKIAEELAASGYTIVSGLARGIDTAAHLGALKAGRTLAVIGSGLHRIYPQENIPLAQKIAAQGAVISSFPLDAPPHKHHFPQRNRLISALSQALLLVEAPIKSGAMITVDLALAQGKKCFVLPGRADIDSFRGNHFLIKSQKAQLVENAREMLSILEPEHANLSFRPISRSAVKPLSVEEEKLMKQLSSEEILLDALALKTEIPISKLSALLMGLVLKGVVRELPGKSYKKII